MVNENLTKKRKISFYLRKYLYLFIGAIITAVGLEIFLIPNNIIDGGVVGIAIMLSAVTGLPFGMFLIVINLPFLFLGYKYIGKHFAIATTFSVICLSFWSNIFLPVLPELQLIAQEPDMDVLLSYKLFHY